MAKRELVGNNASTTLDGSVTSGALTITVNSKTNFPTDGHFRILIGSELLLVTSISSLTFTVIRGVEETTPTSHSDSETVEQVLTQAGFSNIIREGVDPFAFGRPPFRIQDTDGNLLTKSDFTNVNPSGVVIDNSDGSISMDVPATVGDIFPMIVRTAPSPPYTITGAFRATMLSDDVATADGPIIGPVFRNSTISPNGEHLHYRWRPLDNNAAHRQLRINHYINQTFQIGLGSFRRGARGASELIWFQIEDDNTDLFFRYSGDGINFFQIHTEGRTATMTGAVAPNQIGFGISNGTSTIFKVIATLVAWDGE